MNGQIFLHSPVGECFATGVAEGGSVGVVLGYLVRGVYCLEVTVPPLLLGKLPRAEVAGVGPLVGVTQHVSLHGRYPQFGLKKKRREILSISSVL